MIQRISEMLRQSRYTIIFTGAGMSTESGIPDFRSAQGLWRQKDPMQLASTQALKHNKDEFYQFYRERLGNYIHCQPHRGHYILAGWETKGMVKAVITQNVDGFHQKAGSKDVIELHGSFTRLYCLKCEKPYPGEWYLNNGAYCECGGFIRPDVVLFGEFLPQRALAAAQWESRQADLCIVLGSSLQVSPANTYPQIVKDRGGKLIIVNMESTMLDDIADVVVNHRKIGEILAEVDTMLSSHV